MSANQQELSREERATVILAVSVLIGLVIGFGGDELGFTIAGSAILVFFAYYGCKALKHLGEFLRR